VVTDNKAVFLNMHDGYSTFYTFSGAQFTSYRPIVSLLQNGAGEGATWFSVQQTLNAMDSADDIVKGYSVDWANANHSNGFAYGFSADLDAQDAQAVETAFKVIGSWDYALDANDLGIINVGVLGTTGDAIDAGGATSLEIPNAADVSANTGEGMISWDSDNDVLYMGTGAAVKQIPKSGTLTDTKYCTYDSMNGDIDCDSEGGSSSKVSRDYWWPASATLPLEASGDSVAPISKVSGASVDELTVDFDSGGMECRTVNFKVPGDVDTSGTVMLRVHWKHAIPTGTGNAIWLFRHNQGAADGASTDVSALVNDYFDASAANSIRGRLSVATSYDTVSNLGWAANDEVDAEFCRDGPNGADTVTQDALMTGAGVEIPRA